jgi:hypothetical protein
MKDTITDFNFFEIKIIKLNKNIYILVHISNKT